MGSSSVIKSGLLLSGGIDSIAIAWWKRPQWAITIDYGQKAANAEKEAAAQICRELDIEHVTISVDCSEIGSGDMAHTAPHELGKASDWWPYRNQLLITIGCMSAISYKVDELYIGTVNSDGDIHSDGTSEFVKRIDQVICIQEGGIRIIAPAIEYTTLELIQLSNIPIELLLWAHSCHKSDVACGNCRGCNKYAETFEELNRVLKT